MFRCLFPFFISELNLQRNARPGNRKEKSADRSRYAAAAAALEKRNDGSTRFTTLNFFFARNGNRTRTHSEDSFLIPGKRHEPEIRVWCFDYFLEGVLKSWLTCVASEYGVLDEDWTCMDLKTSCSLAIDSVRSIFDSSGVSGIGKIENKLF